MSDIKDIITSLDSPDYGFVFKEHIKTYWGKDHFGNIAFGLESVEKNNSLIESTKSLSLYLNIPCEVKYCNDKVLIKNLNILILKEKNFLELFISLSKIFVNSINYTFVQYFLYLKELFAIEGKKDIKELQGLFGELFTMYYFRTTFEVDISSFYQSENRMKFDFSFSENKKIDIKTTLKEERVHHFRNEQLNSLKYDIKIVSILLRKDDKGLSLYNLIQKSKIMFSQSLATWINIEKMIKNYTDFELKSIKFNQKHLIDNIRIYDSSTIPRLTEKTRDGVFNVEYDSDLTTCNHMDSIEIRSWISNL